MSLLRKKQGFSLIELILSLSVGMVIIITSVIWGSNRLKEANARNNEQKVMITLKNIEDYIVTNSPDGTSKALNPLTNDILVSDELIPFDANKVGQWLYDKDLGNIQVGYATDYPSSNVIELRVKDIDRYTCSRFISRLPGKVLELKLGATYLPYTSKTVDGKVNYNVNTSKALTLCDSFLKDKSNNIMSIRYFAAPDMTKIYTFGGDIAGTSDPNAIIRDQQIQKFKDAFTYTYNIRETHIKTNLSN